MKVLVTGAGGFVGEHLIRFLLHCNHEVVAIGINNGAFLKAMHIKTHIVNILDNDVLNEVMREEVPDAVIHLAAISNVPVSWQKPGLTVDVNIHGALNVLQAFYTANPQGKFINIGSSDEYGLTAKAGIPLTEEMPCRPQNPYSISKYSAEQIICQFGKKYGMNVISTRSFNHYGPGQAKGFVIADFASQIAAIECGQAVPVINVGDISAARDFTYVDDVVKAYAALLESVVDGGIYNVCSGSAVSIMDVLHDMLSLAECEIKVAVDEDKFRPAEVKCFIGDNTKIKKATGWQPVYEYSQGLQNVLAYWRKIYGK